MSSLNAIAPHHDALTAIRRDLHAHPELGLQTPRTAALVAEHLAAWGIEVATGIGGHGIVGTLRGLRDGPTVGLRADMDGLPIEETADVPWRSTIAGRMHACGHDGHTAMLLGAARHLAETRRFAGTARLIFQPGEEGAGGAQAMLADHLFERFPCDAIHGLHNRPGAPLGAFSLRPGTFMAGGAFFDIRVTGVGAHAGRPESGVDPVVAAAQIVCAAQAIVARNLSPLDPAVLSITRIAGGASHNVIPSEVTLSGTARALSTDTLHRLEHLLRRTTDGVAAGLGATASLDFRVLFAPLVNHPAHAAAMADTAASLVGEAAVSRDDPPVMVSEDFSFMLAQVPGAYIQMGIGAAASLHNPDYAFNDAAIPYGAAFLSRLVERSLPLQGP